MRNHAADPAGNRQTERKLRVARRIILGSMVFVLLIMVFLPLLEFMAGAESVVLWRVVLAEALAVPLGVIMLVMLRDRLDGRRDPDPRLYWGSIAMAGVASAALQIPISNMFFLGAWWGVGVFVASRTRGALVSVFLLVLPWLLIPLSPLEIQFVPFLVSWIVSIVWALCLAAGSLASIWLWDVTNDAVKGQRARARLAVTEERLRFARDMHDLLGHSLSALAVKAELANRLVDRAPERASHEMDEVHELARKALQQVRTAVSGYREVVLAEEVASVGAVLSANGTVVSVSGLDGLDLPPRTSALAAWVVREGGTNVLRHSDATVCQIAFTPAKGTTVGRALVVEVSNDGARAGGAPKETSGNGLAGLSERVSMGGGTLSAVRTKNDGFLLRAVLPL
ncbi:sensor histidine kinase [Nocardiopsis sp. NPDC058631]|uniref:sensor histidine kinase n=1 Tax=Nocardiopsis sp. NPDC058631 TaxID=3346566 RepID=UPI003654FCB6